MEWNTGNLADGRAERVTLQDVSKSLAAGRRAEALALLESLVSGEDGGDDWGRVADLAQQLGDDDTALPALERWLAEAPEDARRRVRLIETLERMARTERAHREAMALQQLPGGEAPGLYHQGVCLARQARGEASLDALHAALKADPKLTQCWDYIAAQKRFRPGDRDLMRLQNAAARFRMGDANVLLPLIHALGKANDDMGRTDRAFEKFDEVGRITRHFAPYDVSGPVRYCARLAETFSREFFQRTSVAGHEGVSPVFVVGPPRSGTTLLERMLSMHPSLHAGGEHTLLRLATYRLGNFEPQELRDAFGHDRRVFESCGRDYERRVRSRFGVVEGVIDKTPINHFFVGVIRLMLPDARFIWARRDPRDVAWSCFKTRIQGNRWSEDLDDTVAYIRAYGELMRHWQSVLGDRMLAVDYEELVSDPDTVMKRCFEHLNIGPDDGWRRFHEEPGPSVSTASLSQVRQPLSRHSIGAWRRYEKYLANAFGAFDGNAAPD